MLEDPTIFMLISGIGLALVFYLSLRDKRKEADT